MEAPEGEVAVVVVVIPEEGALEEEVLLEGVRTVLSTWPADDVFGGTVLNFS